MEERIQVKHPQGKRGVNIPRNKYEAMKAAVVGSLKGRELTQTELTRAVETRLGSKFEGSIPWYMEWVKLDLEARHIVERVRGEKAERYRLPSS